MSSATTANGETASAMSRATTTRALLGIIVLLLFAAACSSSTDEASEDTAPASLGFDGSVSVVIPNSPGSISTTGSQRVMTAVIGGGDTPFLGGADLPVTVSFDAVHNDDSGEADGTYLTASDAPLGLYVSYFDFPSPGLWEITLSSDGVEIGQTLFEVTDDSPIPTIGDPAPVTDSVTGTTADEIAAISTDIDPVSGFYDLSIADAVTNDQPTVIVFATPAFCQTALCGPTLETVKQATEGRDDLDVVHVEPFDMTLAPTGTLLPISSMEEWGLQSEPWVFVVDADGMVAATFEGIIGLDELQRALAEL